MDLAMTCGIAVADRDVVRTAEAGWADGEDDDLAGNWPWQKPRVEEAARLLFAHRSV